ncbi:MULTISPECIES: hypothetical protein [Burkholderia cepacia complex]|uniref:hypothetical protein n=1 Tax=Burkholderia cepacia complex TaxID=87882 RepID=UPI0012BA9199|nr:MULTISPECIES: hypothetical protein [Burkholderia cepacia complex]
MESHFQLTGEHCRIAMAGIDRRCPRLGLCSALAASAHVHLGFLDLVKQAILALLALRRVLSGQRETILLFKRVKALDGNA